MSQTETILLIVLGFSLASLIALFVARLLWTAAVKVGVRRMQRQVPSSLVGLQTERDRLRAEHAMLARRLGDQLEAAQQQAAGSVDDQAVDGAEGHRLRRLPVAVDGTGTRRDAVAGHQVQ